MGQIGKIFLEKVKRLGSSVNYNLLCVAKMPVETSVLYWATGILVAHGYNYNTILKWCQILFSDFLDFFFSSAHGLRVTCLRVK